MVEESDRYQRRTGYLPLVKDSKVRPMSMKKQRMPKCRDHGKIWHARLRTNHVEALLLVDRAITLSVVTSWLVGLVFITVLLFSIRDMDGLLDSTLDMPVAKLFWVCPVDFSAGQQ